MLPTPSERVQLRGFVPADRRAYCAYHRRAEVYRYLYRSVPDEQELAAQFDAALSPRFEQEGDAQRLAVVRCADSVLLGEVVLKLASKAARQGEIGFIFDPDHSGKGYATEAVTKMLDIGFEQHGLHRIFARLDPLNARSVALLERIGFRREAHLVENDCFNGVWGDEYIYALLHAEWQNRGAR